MNQTNFFHADSMSIVPHVDADQPNCLSMTFTEKGAACQSLDMHIYMTNIDAILDLGYSIVNAVNKIKAEPVKMVDPWLPEFDPGVTVIDTPDEYRDFAERL